MLIHLTLAVILVISLIVILDEPYLRSFYNKNLNLISKDKLSDTSTQMIILFVSGDKYFQTKFLKELFSKNEVIHLLVLSGSNLVIFVLLISVLMSREHFTYFITKSLVLLTYFAFTSYPHPLARAVFYMTLDDLITQLGLQRSKFRYLLILIFLSAIVAYSLKFSISFILSAYFALAIIIFNLLFKIESKVVKFFAFNLYMTLVSLASSPLFGFKISPIKALVMNFLLTPLFDFFVLIAYLAYFTVPILGTRASYQIIFYFFDLIFTSLLRYLEFWSNTL